MRHLAALLLVCALAGAGHATRPPWYAKPGPPPKFPDLLVTPAWLAGRLGDRGVTVVDARPAARFAGGHVAGAVSLDAAACDPDPRTLGARLGAAGVPDGGTVVCYGDARDPVAAGRLFWLLELAGHRDARVLNGGIEAWRAGGGRLERGARDAAARRFGARPDTSRNAGYDYVMSVFGVKGHAIMEWRPDSAWRAGHIPHSLPFPLGDLARRDGTLLEGRLVRPVFEVYGPRKNEYVPLDDEFIVCGDLPPGAAAVHPYLAARLAAIARVRCYPGGFADWRSRPGAPIVRIAGTAEVRDQLARSAWDRLRHRPPRNAILLDLRERGDYEAGHLPGAILLPSHEFEKGLEAVVAKHWPGVDRATIPFVVYCYGPACTRSRSCTTIAARQGWRNLWWFKDGQEGWRGARLELVRGP